MRVSHLARSLWRGRVHFIETVLMVISLFAACAGGNSVRAADTGAWPGVTESGADEIRVVVNPANPANAARSVVPSVILDQELRSADGAVMQAIAANDRLTAAGLLDSEFTWIDRDGRSRGKSDLVTRLVLLAAGADEHVTIQNYGRVALLTGTHRLTPDNASALFARVWVHQPSGWHLLLYQETTPAEVSLKDARYGGSRAEGPASCDNPCRSLPYKPLSPAAQEIVAAFMAGEEAVFEGDAQAASRVLAEDVLFVTPYRVQPINKAERLAAMGNFRHAGPAGQMDPPRGPQRAMVLCVLGCKPPEVASMALWVFGNSAVMSADEESSSGELLRATRIWAKRDGQWQLAFSQQTLLQ